MKSSAIMKEIRRSVTILCLLLVFTAGSAQEHKGTIVKVIDGDTYIFQTAEGSFRVRSFGIDAPEGNQPFGKESAAFLSRYFHKEGILKTHGTDRYHRVLGTLYFNGEDINLLEVREGYAWHYKRYLDNRDYAAAQEYAKKNRSGLWNLPNPIAPWNWRHVEREEGIFHHK